MLEYLPLLIPRGKRHCAVFFTPVRKHKRELADFIWYLVPMVQKKASIHWSQQSAQCLGTLPHDMARNGFTISLLHETDWLVPVSSDLERGKLLIVVAHAISLCNALRPCMFCVSQFPFDRQYKLINRAQDRCSQTSSSERTVEASNTNLPLPIARS